LRKEERIIIGGVRGTAFRIPAGAAVRQAPATLSSGIFSEIGWTGWRIPDRGAQGSCRGLGMDTVLKAACGAAPLPPELLASYRKLGSEGYGMTETVVTHLPLHVGRLGFGRKMAHLHVFDHAPTPPKAIVSKLTIGAGPPLQYIATIEVFMRGTRWLILVAIIVVVGGVAATYRLQKSVLHDEAPAKPQSMAPELSSAAQDWSWVETSEPPDSRTICFIKAKDARQAKDSNHVELERVELRLPSMHTDTYNLVHSARADYNQSDKRLYSDGAVDITLAVPNEGQPKHTLVSIHSSGVTFDSGTGKAVTTRPATFRFENGNGSAVGASYDPSTRELFLNSQAELHWNPPGPHAKPMKIEAGQVIYRENLAGIWLTPWARLTRDNTIVEGGETVIALEDGKIHHVETHNAHGTDAYPSRKLQYGADRLTVDYGDTGEVEKITGEGNAHLASDSEGSQITATGDRVDLQFADYNGQSTLTLALVNGHGFLQSKPLATPGHDPAETRILRSEVIQMTMRPGGREIGGIETHAPSELEFLPNHAGQRHRKFIGERMWIGYGAQNRVQSFSAVNCRTVSDPTPEEAAKKGPVTTTVSKNVSAAFDPKTSQLTRMEQWEDFSYESGDRKARADRGILEQVENRITLDKHARMWDSTGNTIADRIVLDEKSGNFTAEGHVNTSRLPDQTKKKSDSAMLSGDEPLQAVARNMSSANHNKLVKYDGDVVLWQGVNRIQADRVEIDRDKKSIVADGHVVTQSREDKKADETDPAPAPAAKPADDAPAVFTLVKAPHMVYTDQDRLAHYSGGVMLNRAGLQMKANDLRSWLAEEGADNRLQKAFADGGVQIVQTGPIRTKTGASEHAEYYTDENKIILRGGDPTMNDNVRGNTRGVELTYYSDDDRLVVSGSDAKPAVSHIRKKHPQ
jgi:lipopolysaccharide export system protein LptA